MLPTRPIRLTDEQRRVAEAVIVEHGPGLWRIALVVGGSAQAAEDLLAGAVLRSLPHLDRITVPVPLYLRRVMLNLRTSAWKRTTKFSEHLSADLPDTPSPHDTAESVALRADVAAALDRLAPRQRAVVVLRYLEDRPATEVARILGCTEETVRSQAHRALARLRVLAPDLLHGDHTVAADPPAAASAATDTRSPR